ncbi:MAG: AglZ/HisF2 family acetamidino modification protein [Candidatus Omnitrophica bacterium]|nr:AglZ/HisF2 family acetamidino modification protein [Candidatus Omnitrophota bacterium]
MLLPRILPCLLLQGKGLVKGIKFKDYKYIGDPINTVKIFSNLEVDEIILLDITATQEQRILDPEIVSEIADEAFMPFTIGGGIRTIEHIRQLVNAGAEKVSINTGAIENPDLVKQASEIFGVQSIIVCIDVKKNWGGDYDVYTHCGRKKTKFHPVELAIQMQERGAGEILLNCIHSDGTMLGYDLNILKQISEAVTIPVIACGGAGSVDDLAAGVHDGHATAVAAGSMFVFHGKKKGVLVNYPDWEERQSVYSIET